MAKKMGLINRLIVGSEKSEGYARASLPSNRWELFWDILKGRFWKLVVINLLVLLFCLPLIAVFVLRMMAVSGYGSLSPFTQPFGVGYQAAGSFSGFNESIIFSVNLRIYLLMPVAMAFAALGISGGAYVIRNMVWTEGIFVANDFWRGIKQNYLSVLGILFMFSVVFYITALGVAYDNLAVARGAGSETLLGISKYTLIVFFLFFTIMCLHMITMTVTYTMKMRHLLKNSFLFTLGLLPQSMFFALIAAIPFILLIIGGGFLMMIGIMLLLFFALSFALLVWTDFSQWAYDKFVNDKVPGAQKNRGIYEKVKESDAAALKKYREQMELAGRSALSSRPIKPITDEELTLAELPQSFNRGDIEKLNQSRQALYEDNEKYIAEHINDERYRKSEQEEQAEKTRAERDAKIAKIKRDLNKRDEQERRRQEKKDKK